MTEINITEVEAVSGGTLDGAIGGQLMAQRLGCLLAVSGEGPEALALAQYLS